MYAMLSGRPPFTGKKITEVIDSLQRKKPVPLDMILPDLPDDIVALVNELLAKDADERPPTALAVMNRLKAMRAGLQHQQTLLDRAAQYDDQTKQDHQTKHAGESDASEQIPSERGTDVVDQDLTAISGIVDRNTPRPTGQEGHDTRPSGQPESKKPADAVKPKSVDSDDDITLVSEKTATSQTDDESFLAPREPDTHFQSVIDSEDGGHFARDEADTSGTISHGLSIGILLAILLFGLIFVIKTIKKPSADAIYEQIVYQDSIGQLAASRSEIDRFMKLFPDDKRIEDVRRYDASLRLTGLLRRLHIKKKIALNPLDAYEQGFLEAIRLSETDPPTAAKKLNQWLDVFADPTIHKDDERVEMAELARYEVERLSKLQPASPVVPLFQDPRVRELSQRINAAKDLPLDQRKNLLEGVVSLYADEKWAQPAIDFAQRNSNKSKLTRSINFPMSPQEQHRERGDFLDELNIVTGASSAVL